MFGTIAKIFVWWKDATPGTLLTLAMRNLPLGTAYMIWTGIGAVGAFAAGVWLLGEDLSLQRLIAAGLIVAGMVTMKLS